MGGRRTGLSPFTAALKPAGSQQLSLPSCASVFHIRHRLAPLGLAAWSVQATHQALAPRWWEGPLTSHSMPLRAPGFRAGLQSTPALQCPLWFTPQAGVTRMRVAAVSSHLPHGKTPVPGTALATTVHFGCAQIIMSPPCGLRQSCQPPCPGGARLQGPTVAQPRVSAVKVASGSAGHRGFSGEGPP